ncbi:serine/threonine-protein kinase [Frankia sp. QA3]|uniref:serine/threonine-protein kinase n=1 Tax=Frankia sp. QA3 TaxID=710111 RepID=UPI000269CE56|nr:serine/threonine-protein kinase [Frankia sp. QA3]EIV96193.1 protein kinase family protein [Frankia sp. QA3]
MIVQGHVQAVLPDYQIGAELGRGGFGRVFAARHRRLDRDVAVKALAVPAPDLPADGVDGVDAEARIVASLDHPHIVRVFDYVRDADMALIVMELLPGGTLARRARAGLAPPAACATVAAVAVALDRVHREGLLHRDIKPSNILFAADGAPKLTDFGIARLLEVTGTATPTSVVGSTPYLAPEQFDLAAAGVAADVYALGAVLYELLAGSPPFGADPRPHVMAERHRRAVPLPLPRIPAELAAVTLRALAKDPADRQPSALGFAEDLIAAAGQAFGADWLAGTGISFRGEQDLRRRGRRSLPPTRRYRLAGTDVPTGSRQDGAGPLGGGLAGGGLGGDGLPDGGLPDGGLADGRQADDGPTGDGLTGDGLAGGNGAGRGSAAGGDASGSRYAGFLRSARDRAGSRGWPAAALTAVVLAVAVLLATGVLRVGPANTAGPGPEPAHSSAPPAYPVSAPLPLRGLVSLAADGSGGILLADSSQHALTMFARGTASTVVGRAGADRSGQPGPARDEPAAVAALRRPAGIAAGGGSVFVADEWNCVVRRVHRPAGQPWRVETVAGRPSTEAVDRVLAGAADRGATVAPATICPAGGPDGPKNVGAQIGTPTGVAVSPTGALYFTTGYAGQVWKIDPAAGSGDYRTTAAQLVAGNGAAAARGHRAARERRYDDGTDRATEVPLDNAYSVAVDAAGRVFVLSYADGHARIHAVEDGRIRTVVDRELDDAGITSLTPAPGGGGVLFTDARHGTVWQVGDRPAGTGTGAARPVLREACVGDTERLFGILADRSGDLYYTCNDASQASLYRMSARALAAGGSGPGQRLLY